MSTQQEEIGVPKEDIGKSHQYSKCRISDPSNSVEEINIPEVNNLSAQFVYNYYVSDERVSPQNIVSSRGQQIPIEKMPLEKIARYVILNWDAPYLSTHERSKNETAVKSQSLARRQRIANNIDKICSEDNFFNPHFTNHTFSNIDAIEQGAEDIEINSRIAQHDTESVAKMGRYQFQDIVSNSGEGDAVDDVSQTYFDTLFSAYGNLADFPKDSLGLRVYDPSGKPNDEDDLMRSISDSLSLTMKINSSILPDVFRESKEYAGEDRIESFRESYGKFVSSGGNHDLRPGITPVYNTSTLATNERRPIRLMGYIIDRYVASQQGFTKDKTFVIESIEQSYYHDKTALYGVTYVYAIRVIAAVEILTYSVDKTRVDVSGVFIGSRPVSTPVECYEYTPPPPPNDIKFTFNHSTRELKIHWDTPVNPQRDIKQFQLLRRGSIKEPFELIAQFGFDSSEPGPDGERYKTRERIDANNVSEMRPEDLYLVKSLASTRDEPGAPPSPVYSYVDEDFSVDPEFQQSSQYIYALCSVDAHGIISNYSSQHRVRFDSFSNKLVTEVICDAGSPRQYPNMNLRTDMFKDVIRIDGDVGRKLTVYFTPEYLTVRGDGNAKYTIVEAQNVQKKPYYLLQMINLDNQKLQTLKINIKDPQNLTT